MGLTPGRHVAAGSDPGQVVHARMPSVSEVTTAWHYGDSINLIYFLM